MSSTTLSYPKTLDANWPAVRAKNFIKALKMKPGKNYAENMAILAAKASVTVEELIAMNPVRYAERNGMNCEELLGRRIFDHFYWENGPAVPAVAVAAAVAVAVAAAPVAAVPAAPAVVAVPAAPASPAAPVSPAEAKDPCTLPMTNNKMQKLTSYKNVKLPPGTYYIGDLCYVLGDSWIYKKAWDSIDYAVPSFFRSESGCIVVDRTAYGDGSYSDNGNRSYSVDAGVLSIVSIELIENHLASLSMPHAYTMRNLTDGGHIFTFKDEVTINFGGGLFRVCSGYEKVRIDTDPPPFGDECEGDE